ncbi:PREDICTED: gastric triacylglycerol lipase-like [Branchiostoma belcheri]|uniref:Gastric triacylglycerol lipase-like n=1 Tax=Branchiostoma belcheri TaxID=7741 RepID=A0A6P5A3M4_BRABE|nr:PREDICTED: gastric triacylglycerol lipase-like [Branchiostoma belcheri]
MGPYFWKHNTMRVHPAARCVFVFLLVSVVIAEARVTLTGAQQYAVSTNNLVQWAAQVFHRLNVPRHSDGVTADPEENMNATQLITSKGYPCEDHYVTTDDGFILNMQRIPHGLSNGDNTGPRPIVFLQHGLLGSSTQWIENLANESLGFILADAGFEVWLGNIRGNTYSKRHVKLKPSQEEFWAWSWDEMAKYDLPKMLTHALNVTKQTQLYYVGHSQGTMIGFAEFSRNQELARKVKTFFALAPVAYLGNMVSPLRLLSNFLEPIELIYALLGKGEFMPTSEFIRFLGQEFCDKPVLDVFCENILFLIAGFNYGNMNVTRIPVYVSHSPAGTSVQNMVHFAQLYQSGKFQMFDYGPQGNMLKYNQTTAPEYNATNVKLPVAMFSGGHDSLADPKDVVKLEGELPNITTKTVLPEWEHLDFIWGMDAARRCYTDIIKIINSVETLGE